MTWINEWLGHDRLCHVSHVSMLQRKRDRTGLQSKKTTKVNWSRYCRHNPKMPFSAWSNEEVISNTESAYVTSLKIIRRELQSGKKKRYLTLMKMSMASSIYLKQSLRVCSEFCGSKSATILRWWAMSMSIMAVLCCVNNKWMIMSWQ